MDPKNIFLNVENISSGKNYGPKGVGFGITANIEAS